MNADRILDIIAKGMALVETLRFAAEAASPAIKAMYELLEQAKTDKEITEEELARVEAILDGQLDLFNEPLPEDEA